MFDALESPSAGSLSTAELAAFVGRLSGSGTDVGDGERLDRMRLLEELKSAAAAAQARTTVAFAGSQRDEQRAAGVPAARVGQGIAAQVGLARRESPARAARYVGWTKILVEELPETFGALARGETSEWRAMLVARETIWLSRADRATVDTALAGRLAALGDRQVEAETKKLAYRLDPHGFVARSRAAERDRRVSLRPAPDTMARLTALLPAAQGVAAYAALAQAADTARAGGDGRGRGQVMADTLVERVTGQTSADAVPVEIALVMTDRALAGTTGHPDAATRADGATRAAQAAGAGGAAHAGGGGADEPAHLLGYGPVPAGIGRDIARGTEGTAGWLRRIHTNPDTGQLAAIDARRRRFDGATRYAIIVRDQICRTPWCGAPIRHADHAAAVADGGATNLDNGQGLCEACNYAKQAPGWSVTPGPGGTSTTVLTTTPTGHTYASRPPELPGQRDGPAPPTAHHHAA